MKNFKPIAIGVNEGAEREYNRLLIAKRSDLRDLNDYASRFIQIDDYTVLFKDFKNHFRNEFAKKFADQFPNLVSQQKQLELVDCDISKIDALSDKIESNTIALDENLQPTEKTDFNIYTRDENQNKMYKTLCRISDDYKSLKDGGLNIFPMAIVNGTSQALKYDFQQAKLIPNVAVFTSTWRRI